MVDHARNTIEAGSSHDVDTSLLVRIELDALIEELLSALTKEEQDFILLLTTNQRDGMDEAILRPGRVDSEFEIGLPDAEARTEILKLTVLGVPHKLGQEHIEHLVAQTKGWSGAELNTLGNQAKLGAAERGATHLEWKDIKTAHREVAVNRSR